MLFARGTWSVRCRFVSVSKCYSTAPAALEQPLPDGAPKQYPEKIHNIVQEISKLTLFEVSELNQLLKQTLKIPDAPVMTYGAMPQTSAQPVQDEDEKPQNIVKTLFTIKLTNFDDGKKIQLIKEIKNLIPGLNLVQAKKFVESTPQVVKADVSKAEADQLAEAIKVAGGTCEIE